MNTKLPFSGHSPRKVREPSRPRITLAEEQIEALERMKDFLNTEEPVLVLQGYAGTGKTSILNEYIQFLRSTREDFILCAPTHKAKLVVEEVTGEDAMTVHKLLSLAPNIEIFELDYKDLKFQCNGFGEIPDNGIVIIDEASMINDEIYKLLLDMCNQYGTKLLFIGDKAQIQPVCSKSTSLVFNCPNIITLTQIHRQADTNGLLPLLSRLRERPLKRFEPIEAPEGSLIICDQAKDFMLKSADFFRRAIKKQDVNEVKLIAYTNARVQGFNQCMRKLLWDTNVANEYNQFEFLTGYENFEYNNTQFYNSLDYIIVDAPKRVERHIPHFMKMPGYELELFDTVYKKLLTVFILERDINKDYIDSLAATIENFRISAIEAKRNGNRTRSTFLWKKYFEMIKSFATPKDIMWDNRVIKKKTFDYGYASTIHKIQGSSLGTVFIDMANVLVCKNVDEIRQMQYVSLSRTKTDAYILV